MDQIKIFKALADQTRLDILKLLLAYNYCAKSLSRKLNVSEAAVSQHIKLLREVGLVTGEKRGYFIHYSINRDVINKLGNEIIGMSKIEQSSCTQTEDECCAKEKHHCHIATSKFKKEEVN